MSRAPEYILGEIFILFYFSLLLLLFWFFFFYRICFSTFGFVVLSASFLSFLGLMFHVWTVDCWTTQRTRIDGKWGPR